MNKPAGTMTKKQVEIARKLAGTMDRNDIAKKLDVSLANLKRSCKFSFAFHTVHKSNPERTQKIIEYYEKHGGNKTKEKFKNISIRSVVEHYKRKKPRCIRWTDEQMVKAVQMRGFVSEENQAKIFNRPRANAGSIKSLWNKRFGFSSLQVHGLCASQAKHIIRDSAKTVNTGFIKIVLWVDLEKNLDQTCPQFIKDAISSLARFQRWIFRSQDPKKIIIRMIDGIS